MDDDLGLFFIPDLIFLIQMLELLTDGCKTTKDSLKIFG